MTDELAVSPPSPAAQRMRRSRQRRRQGGVVLNLGVGPSEISALIALGWLLASDRGDKSALAGLIEHALAMRVTPPAKLEGLTLLRATDGLIANEFDECAQLPQSPGMSAQQDSFRHAGPGAVLADAGGAVEIAKDNPQERQPWPEPTRLYEVDAVELWTPRLDLYRHARIWSPTWGRRPDQIGCGAPEWLIEEYGIPRSGLVWVGGPQP